MQLTTPLVQVGAFAISKSLNPHISTSDRRKEINLGVKMVKMHHTWGVELEHCFKVITLKVDELYDHTLLQTRK